MIERNRLADICKITSGYSFASSDYQKEGILLIRIGNIIDGSIVKTNDSVFLNSEKLEQYSDYIVEKGDILIALSGATTGKYGIYSLNEPALLNQRIGIIKLSQTSENITQFIYFYLTVIRDQILKKAQGAAQPNISTKEIENFEIPKLESNNLRTIVSLLDKADSIRKKRKETIKLADEFLRSTFLEMFGDPYLNPKEWEKVPFSKIAKIDRTSIDPMRLNKKTNYIGLEDIESKTGKITNVKEVENGDLKSNKFRFTQNHILFGKLRPYLNKIANPDFDGICSTDILPILPRHNKCNREFLTFLMRHKAFIDFTTEKSSGANLPRISPNIIANHKIISPDITLQNKFSEVVEKTEMLKEKYQQSLEESENLFNSLMQRAFKGEL